MELVCPDCGARNRVPDERAGDEPVCGRCGAALTPAAPVALGDADFDRYVAHSGQPVVVDFWADWCGPCKMMAPEFATAAQRVRDVRFAKVDTEAAQQVAARHGIRSIPTMILFDGGREVARRSGAMRAADIAAWLQSARAGR